MSKRLSKVADDFESLRTRLAPPGSAAAESSPAKALPLPPSSGTDESTLSRFTSILSRLETVTDQVSELREKLSKPFEAMGDVLDNKEVEAAAAGAVAIDEYVKEKCELEELPSDYEVVAAQATVFNVMGNKLTVLPPGGLLISISM